MTTAPTIGSFELSGSDPQGWRRVPEASVVNDRGERQAWTLNDATVNKRFVSLVKVRQALAFMVRMSPVRILVVEDEKKVASFIKKGLEEEGYAVDVAADGEEGLALGLTRVHDLIILDIRLPKMDGLHVLQALRQDDVTAPVLLLTVRATIEDKVLGLDAGADDYLTKPFRLSGTGGAGARLAATAHGGGADGPAHQ